MGKRQKHRSSAREVLLVGRRPLAEILKFDPARVKKVFLAGDLSGKDESVKSILARCAEQDIACERIDAEELNSWSGTAQHQGLAALLSPRPIGTFEDSLQALKDEPCACLLALDQLQDPQNLGAILRVSECLGVDTVFWSKDRSAPLSVAARKASAGASELVSLAEVGNLVEALKKSKDAGFWIVGASASPEAQSLSSFEFPERSVIVMGSEGKGIRELVRKNLDFEVMIPMTGRIDSLNVSQATSIMLYEYQRQHGSHPRP